MNKTLFSAFLLSAALLFGSIGADAQTSGKAYWFGSVDNKLHLVISGTTIEHITIAGQARPDGSYSFTAPLPRSESTVRVSKLEGRSANVTVVQQPTAANNYQAIVEIVDEGGGAREYLIEIAW